MNFLLFAEDVNDATIDNALIFDDEYTDKTIKNNDRIEKVISYDGTYDVFSYNLKTGKIEKIETFDYKDNLIETNIFYRDSITGELLAVKHNDKINYLVQDGDRRKFYLLWIDDEEPELYDTFFSSLVIKEDVSKKREYEYLENGNLIIKSDDKISEYDKYGKIIKDGENVYNYNENGELVSIEYYKDKELIEKECYENAAILAIEQYKNGKIFKRTKFDNQQKCEEYFENGIMYARSYYSDDEKKVVKIEYI